MNKSLSKRTDRNGKGGLRGLSKAVGLSALLASTCGGCTDMPFAPKWDADIYLPVMGNSFPVMDFLPLNYIPAGISARVSSSPQRYDIPLTMEDIVKNLVTDSSRSHLVFYLTLEKRMAVSVDDTVFVSPDSSSAAYADQRWILFPIKMEAADTLYADSVVASQPSIEVLQAAASNGNPLWIQTSGNLHNYTGSQVMINPGDSISANLSVAARIRVSGNQ